MSDEKAKQELYEALHETVSKVGPLVRTGATVLRDSIEMLRPLFADFNESARKAARAARKLSEAKKMTEKPYDAKAHSERYP